MHKNRIIQKLEFEKSEARSLNTNSRTKEKPRLLKDETEQYRTLSGEKQEMIAKVI